MNNTEFAGLNGFVWWVGVVEDRQDPLKLGRCRVRIVGWHSDNVVDAPTSSLPWAQAMMPLNNPNTYTPKESDMVVGFFLDGDNAQQPIMMGVLPGIPLNKSSVDMAFGDTREQKQIEISPRLPNTQPTRFPRNLDEPTTSRLARGESSYTPTQINWIKQKMAGNKYGVEKTPAYNARYPYNNAIETESGHAFEMDDTPDYERVNIMHRLGSYMEFRPEGSVQEKVVGSATKVVDSDDLMHVKGNRIVYVDGDLTYKVGGTVTFEVGKDFKVSAENILMTARSNWSGSAKLSASLSGTISSSLGGTFSGLSSVTGVITNLTGMTSITATSSGKGTYGGGAGTLINGAKIALVNGPAPVADGGDGKKPEPPAAGSPFTDPVNTPETTGIAESAIDSASLKYGVPNPSADQIISQSIKDNSYLNNVIYGPTSYNWTNPVQVSQSMSFVNPTFAEALKKDLVSGLDSLKTNAIKFGTGVYNSTGISGLESSYVDASAKLNTAIATGKLADYKIASSSVVDLIGKGAQVGVNITNLNTDVIKATDFVKNSCAVDFVKDWAKDVAKPLSDNWETVKSEMKSIETKIKDLDPKLQNRLSELRRSIDSFDEKALDEFVNANHKDEACRVCAQEAGQKIKNGVDRKTVSNDLSNCLYKEYTAFKQTYASKLPLTDKTAVENLKNNC